MVKILFQIKKKVGEYDMMILAFFLAFVFGIIGYLS